MIDLKSFKIKIFADGADKEGMLAMYKNPYIKGFTTNPTLMRKAGVANYSVFAKEIVKVIPDRPVSFEVFSDEFDEMERQALTISSWGKNIYVKIPITNTRGEWSGKLVQRLALKKVQLNVTAITTLEQVKRIAPALKEGAASYISVFAGRVADTGRDPVPHIKAAMDIIAPFSNIELLWASPRELLNIVQAESVGCHVITVTNDLLAKIPLLNKDLDEYSLETVKMFYDDAQKAKYTL